MDKIPFTELAKIFNVVGDYKEGEETHNDIVLFYRKKGLPKRRNEIYIQNKYYDKEQQYELFKKEFVNTVKTYNEQQNVNGKFIAKMKTGQRQKGQLINQTPEHPEEYIFQPLVDIKKEYRVIVYYMSGKYHVSGIYEKIGSNISLFKVDENSKEGKGISIIAKKATRVLGYGFGGVDIAIVEPDENKVNVRNTTYPNIVVLEVNTLPSLKNPRILIDFVQDANKNRSRGLL